MALVETLLSDAEVIRQTKGIGHATRTLVSPNQFPLKLIGCIERADTMKKIDLTGQRFGRLVAIKEAGKDKWGGCLWDCLCDCGDKTIVGVSILKAGQTKSCGCLRKERLTTHNLSRTPTHRTWGSLVNRCNNSNNAAYNRYGGRGIKVCDEWLKFENFYEDMGNRPDGLSIDRINNNKGYYKENCRWATPTEQARNQRISNNNTTGIKGVHWNKRAQKYQAQIRVDYKRIHLGYFNNLEDAKQVRINAEHKYWK